MKYSKTNRQIVKFFLSIIIIYGAYFYGYNSQGAVNLH